MRPSAKKYRRKGQHPNHGAYGGSKEDGRDYHENRPHEDQEKAQKEQFEGS